MKLYTYFASSAAFRVRIALNLKSVAYEPVYIHLRKNEQFAPDYVALNPQEQVPTLIDGDAVLRQSLAIIEYLEETRPQPPLLPVEPAARARVRAIALGIACDIHPLNNLRVLRFLTGEEMGHDEAGRDTWYRHWIRVGLTGIERMLAAGPEGRFCHGDSPTLADICLVPQIFNARRFECPLDDYPTVMRVFDACMELDAFDRAQPSKQPDAA